jgi:hypothetical protein
MRERHEVIALARGPSCGWLACGMWVVGQEIEREGDSGG